MTKDNSLPITTVYSDYLTEYQNSLHSLKRKTNSKHVYELYKVMTSLRVSQKIIENLLEHPVIKKKHKKRFNKLYRTSEKFIQSRSNIDLVRKYDRKYNLGIELFHRYQEIKLDIYKGKLITSLKKMKGSKYQLNFDQYNFLTHKYGKKSIRIYIKDSIMEKLHHIRSSAQPLSDKEIHGIRSDLRAIHIMSDQLLMEKKSTRVEQLLVLIRDTEVAVQKWSDFAILYDSVKKFRKDTRQSSIINFSLHNLLQGIEREKSLLSNKVWELVHAL